jgi:hypothetical protein
MCLHRHTDLVENVTTLVVDVVRNHFEPFFEDSLPSLLRNDPLYFRFINTILSSLLSRETSKLIIERTGVMSRWCGLASTLLLSEASPLQKTDYLVFLVNAWIQLPEYFESIPGISQTVIEKLSDFAANSKSTVMHEICCAKLFELLERFSLGKRKSAPEIYRHLIALLLSADKQPIYRDRIIQGFINMFLSSQVPTTVLLDAYLPHVQRKMGIDLDINVFDLDFMKFLVRDPRLAQKFKIMMFDIFCRIVLSTNYGTCVFLELVELAIELLSSEQRQVVQKFFDVSMRFFQTTYKARKIVPGQVNEIQSFNMHKRAIVCKLFLAVIPRLKDDLQARLEIKKRVLEIFFDITEHYEKNKGKAKGPKGQLRGLREILSLFGEVDDVLEQYMRENNMYYGSELHAQRGGSEEAAKAKSKEKLEKNAQQQQEELQLAKKAEEKLAEGIALTQEERVALTRYQNAQRIAQQKAKQQGSKKDEKEKEHESKLELYNKLREKGIVDDPVGVRKLEEFKQKIREKQDRAIDQMASEKLKDMKQKDSLKTLLEQRRVELGVQSSFLAEDGTEKLIYPLNLYEKYKGKFEVETGMVEIELLDLNRLEKLDADAVRYKMSEFRKLWRNIFNLYANCLKGFEKGADFNKIKDQLNRISRMEFWKFVKDYNLTNFITQEEVAVLFKQINTKIRNNHTDLSYLDYEGLKEMMLQSIYLMYSRPPIDLSHLPPAFAIDKFVEMVKKKYKDEGMKTDFFEAANKFSVTSDPQVVEYLDQKLKEDPDYPIPHKYERIVEKKVIYKPKLCEALKVPESYEICYSIVADLVKGFTEIDLLEMIPLVEETYKVRSKTFKEMENEENVRDKDAIYKSRGDFKIKTPKLTTNRRVLKIDHANIEPGVVLKLAISEANIKDQDLAKECAIVLEELLRAAEKGMDKYTIIDKFEPIPVENPHTRLVEETQKRGVEIERERNLKREERNKRLKEIILKEKGDLDWQARYKKKMEDIEKTIRKKKNPNEQATKVSQKHLEDIERYKKEQKEKLKQHHERMEDLKRNLIKSQESARREAIEAKKKEFAEFNLKEIRKSQQKYRKLEKLHRNLSASMSRAGDYKAVQQEMEPSKVKHLQEFNELKKRLESKRAERDKIVDDILNDPMYKDFTERHHKQLSQIYNFYLRQQNYELRDPEDPDLLPHAGMRVFCHDFQIVPFVLTPNEEAKLFNRFSTERKLELDGGEPGLNYVQFTRLLCAICTRKTKLFNKIFENRVCTMQDFEFREKAREDHKNKIADIKKKEEDKKARTSKSQRNLEVVDVETARAAEARKDKEETDKKKEEEAKKMRRTKEEEYIQKLQGKPLRFFEGFIAYLQVPDVRAGVTEAIQQLQNSKSQPSRLILKSSACLTRTTGLNECTS